MTQREQQLEEALRRVKGIVDAALAAPQPDACTELVARIYREEYRREPDAEGLVFWVGRCRAGMTEAEIRAAFRANPEQPPAPPPPAPPAGDGQPPVIAIVAGPDLTGSHGNPKLVGGIPTDGAAVYAYAIGGESKVRFMSAGQAHNGNPPWVWFWAAEAPNGRHVTTPVKLNGQSVTELELDAAALRARGITTVYYHEQPTGEPAPAGGWNRYAQAAAS